MRTWCPPICVSVQSSSLLLTNREGGGGSFKQITSRTRGEDSYLPQPFAQLTCLSSRSERRHYERLSPVIAPWVRAVNPKLLVTVDVGEKKRRRRRRKKSPGGRAASAPAAAFSPDPLCVDVVKWLVRKCERDNDRLRMTPLGAPHLSCEAPFLSHIHPPLQLLSQRLQDAFKMQKAVIFVSLQMHNSCPLCSL